MRLLHFTPPFRFQVPRNTHEIQLFILRLSDVIAQIDVYDKLCDEAAAVRVGVTSTNKNSAAITRLREITRTSRKGYAKNRLMYAMNRHPMSFTWSSPFQVKLNYLVRGMNDGLAGNAYNEGLAEESVAEMYYGPSGSIYNFGYETGSSILSHQFLWEP